MADQPLVFKELLSQRTLCTNADLAIVGGTISELEIANWLKQWDLRNMPWQLREWVNDLKLQKAKALPAIFNLVKRLPLFGRGQHLPSTFDLVERLRLFGKGGDLTMRRDGHMFRWHFIGSSQTKVPQTPKPRDFWEEHPSKILYRIDQQVILWGAWDETRQRWYDDRVGWANLDYPQELHGKRHVYAHFWEYLDTGRVAFVWMYDLSDKRSDSVIGE